MTKPLSDHNEMVEDMDESYKPESINFGAIPLLSSAFMAWMVVNWQLLT